MRFILDHPPGDEQFGWYQDARRVEGRFRVGMKWVNRALRLSEEWKSKDRHT